MGNDEQTYRLTYAVKQPAEPVAVADVPTEAGAADALVLLSRNYAAEGGVSQVIASYDGRRAGAQPLDPREVFEAWMLMAETLCNDVELDEGRRLAAWTAFSGTAQMIYGRAPDVPPGLQQMMARLAAIANQGGLVGYRVQQPARDELVQASDYEGEVDAAVDNEPRYGLVVRSRRRGRYQLGADGRVEAGPPAVDQLINVSPLDKLLGAQLGPTVINFTEVAGNELLICELRRDGPARPLYRWEDGAWQEVGDAGGN